MSNMDNGRQSRGILFFALTLSVLILDQATKILAVNTIRPYESIRVLPFFQLVNVRNQGAAFGLFQSAGNTVFIIISLLAVVFIFFLILKNRDDRLSLSIILGGALGNLVDRVRLGHVTDFLDFYVGKYHWPAFNLADSALTAGIVLLLIRTFIKSRLPK